MDPISENEKHCRDDALHKYEDKQKGFGLQ